MTENLDKKLAKIQSEKALKRLEEELEKDLTLSEEEFKKKKEQTLEKLNISKDRAEGFLKESEDLKKPKKD